MIDPVVMFPVSTVSVSMRVFSAAKNCPMQTKGTITVPVFMLV